MSSECFISLCCWITNINQVIWYIGRLTLNVNQCNCTLCRNRKGALLNYDRIILTHVATQRAGFYPFMSVFGSATNQNSNVVLRVDVYIIFKFIWCIYFLLRETIGGLEKISLKLAYFCVMCSQLSSSIFEVLTNFCAVDD